MSDKRQPPPEGEVSAQAPDEGERSAADRSVLPRIEKQLGKPVRVELRPSGAEGEPTNEEGELLEGKYRLHGELGRGGVGVVLQGSDMDLGREVAIKVLRAEHHTHPDVMKRFVEEAQIGGQLQHPGVVPVYDLGMVDGRPFFAMKLIRGSSLDRLLAARAHLREGRRRFLGIFEQVCQTVAYAHERGVIHRDLKPGNVMVGAFGEVQVVDWGMGKVLGRPDSISPAERAEPKVETVRSTSTDVRSELGSMMGTLGYMPPEQVRGQVDSIDQRSDVFALGAILFEILTGDPPQTGTPPERFRMAVDPETWRIEERLALANVDTDLVDLVRQCLAPDRLLRPRSAKEVAERTAGYLSAVEERAQRAQVEAAEAQAHAARAEASEAESRERAAREEARAEKERAQAERATLRAQAERRKRVAALMIGAALLVAVGGGAWGLVQASRARATDLQRRLEEEQRAAAETARLSRNTEAVATLLDQGETALRSSNATRARIALDAARRRVDEGVAAGDAQRLMRLTADLELLAVLDETDQLRWSWIQNDKTDRRLVAAKAHEGLRRFGADPGSVPAKEAAARWQASTVRERIVSTMDLLLLEDEAHAVRAVLGLVDADPFRDAVRDAVLDRDWPKVRELLEDPATIDQPPGFAAFIGEMDAVDRVRRLQVLEAAVIRRPTDVRLLMALHCYSYDGSRATVDECMRWAQAAVTAAPDNAAALANLGGLLAARGRFEEAIACCQRALRIDPTNWVIHNNLGNALRATGRPEEAIAAYRRALELTPTEAVPRCNLAKSLLISGEVDEALDVARQAVGVAPGSAAAHATLGVLLEAGVGRPGEAIPSYRNSLRIDPRDFEVWQSLGNVLQRTGDPEGARACYRWTTVLDPGNAENWRAFGGACLACGLPAEALAALRKPTEMGITGAEAQYSLAVALSQENRVEDAIAAYRKAIELDPTHAESWCNLGGAYVLQGRFVEAVEANRRGHELGSKRLGWSNPSARWLEEAEWMAAIEPRLPAFLSGAAQAGSTMERIQLINVCWVKSLYVACARFCAEAFAADPAIAEDLVYMSRSTGASSAALAAAGRGQDAAGLDDEERLRLARQALDWFRADLAMYTRRAVNGEEGAVTEALQKWARDPKVGVLREPEGLALLPEAEQHAFATVFGEMDALERGGPEAGAQSLGVLAAQREAEGRRAEAEALYRKALPVERRAHPGDSRDTATMLEHLGMLRLALGPPPEARVFLDEALAMRQRLFPGDHADVARSLCEVAAANREGGSGPEAIAFSREALDMRRRLFPGDHEDVAASLVELGASYLAEHRRVETEQAFEGARAMYARLPLRDDRSLALDLDRLGNWMRYLGRRQDAEWLLTTALAMRMRLDPLGHPDTVQVLNDFATVLREQDRLEEAWPLQVQALQMSERVFQDDDPRMAMALYNQALGFLATGRPTEAESLARQSLEMYRRLRPGDDEQKALAQYALAGILDAQGRRAEALPVFEVAVGMMRRLFWPSDPVLMQSEEQIGVTCYWLGDYERAIRVFEAALRARQFAQGPHHPQTLFTMANLAANYASARRMSEALPLFETVWAQSEGHPELITLAGPHLVAVLGVATDPDDAPAVARAVAQVSEIVARLRDLASGAELANSLSGAGSSLNRLRAYDAAEPLLREALEIRREKAPAEWTTFLTMSSLGESLRGLKRFAEAEPLLLEGYRSVREREAAIPSGSRERLPECLERLVRFYETTGNTAEAAVWRRALEEERKITPKPPPYR